MFCAPGQPLFSVVYPQDLVENFHYFQSWQLIRLQFSEFICILNEGKPVIFQLYEKTTVKGIFSAMDSHHLQILVTDLETPSGKQKEAILRTSDIVSFCLDL